MDLLTTLTKKVVLGQV